MEYSLFSSSTSPPKVPAHDCAVPLAYKNPKITPTATNTLSTPTATPNSLTPLPDLLVDWMKIELKRAARALIRRQISACECSSQTAARLRPVLLCLTSTAISAASPGCLVVNC